VNVEFSLLQNPFSNDLSSSITSNYKQFLRCWSFRHFCFKSSNCRIWNRETKLRGGFLLSVDSPWDDTGNFRILLNPTKKIVKFRKDVMLSLYLLKSQFHLSTITIKICLKPMDLKKKCKWDFLICSAWNLVSNPYS